MKLTKKQTAILTTKKGTIKKCYIDAIKKICKNDKIVDCNKAWYGGFKKGLTLRDSEFESITDVLKIFDIDFTIKNNAPRGGVCGDYIELKRKASSAKIDMIKKLLEDIR